MIMRIRPAGRLSRGSPDEKTVIVRADARIPGRTGRSIPEDDGAGGKERIPSFFQLPARIHVTALNIERGGRCRGADPDSAGTGQSHHGICRVSEERQMAPAHPELITSPRTL